MNGIGPFLQETLENGDLEKQLRSQFRRWRHLWDFDDFQQEVLLRAWGKRDTFRGDSNEEFLAWLRRIAWSAAIDHWRSEKRRTGLLKRWTWNFFSMLHDVPNRIDTKDLIGWLLAGLAEREIRLVALRYYEDLKMSEIAQVLGITEAAANQLHFRAIEKLRQRLKKKEESP